MTPFACLEPPGEVEKSKRFRLHDGKIVYLMQQAEEVPQAPAHCRGDGDCSSVEWFGCSICSRWFPDMSQLEDHYDREHELAETYKFELLELKSCVIQLPYVEKPLRVAVAIPGNTLTEKNQHTVEGSNGRSQRKCHGNGTKLSMKQAIRQAIKDTQDMEGKGSSYKKIKSYLLKKMGMNPEKVGRKLRRLLEYYVEYKKLDRQYSKGKTLYSFSTSKRERGVECRIPREESRRSRDQKLKKIVKSLKPHGILLMAH